jgi:flagellin
MGLRIATNMQSVNAQRSMTAAVDANQQSMERLASGFRINRAADDAAGLAMSEKMKADIRGLNVAKRNASDGISLIQTAEGSLNEVTNIVARLRELSVQASSDTVSDTERGFLNKEFVQLKDEITRIAGSTEFNGVKLVNGPGGDEKEKLLEVQVGKNYDMETDRGEAPVNVIRLDFNAINVSLGQDGLDLETTADVSNKDAAQKSISALDSALTKISEDRATLGALQNRLSSSINNLGVAIENASAANSRIRDTDFADETAKMTQTAIMKQSGVAVLAQANNVPQMALRLLG